MRHAWRFLKLLIASVILWAAMYYGRSDTMDIGSLLWFKQLSMLVVAMLIIMYSSDNNQKNKELRTRLLEKSKRIKELEEDNVEMKEQIDMLLYER